MELLTESWPYLTLFGTLFLTGIGLPPLPEELPVIAAGIAANREEVVWWRAWPVCVLGVVFADCVLYGVGWLWGKSLFHRRWVNRVLPPKRRAKLENEFHRHAVKILLLGRLLPGTRTGVFLTAGSVRYPFLRFLVVDGLTAILSVGCVFFGSYFLMQSFTLLLGEVNRFRSAILVFVGVALTLYLLWRFSRRTVTH